jgi:hypothetical protein
VLNYRLTKFRQRVALKMAAKCALTTSDGKFESLALEVTIINSSSCL